MCFFSNDKLQKEKQIGFMQGSLWYKIGMNLLRFYLFHILLFQVKEANLTFFQFWKNTNFDTNW